MHIALWLPECLQWPFCPGVFIAFLGFLAAILVFLDKPSRLVKLICVFLFFGLMLGEVWMLSKDRVAHDRSEQDSRDASQQVLTNIALLTRQVNSADAHVNDLKSEMEAAKGNPQLLASLQIQATAAKSEAERASRELLLAIAPGLAGDLHALGLRWWNEEGSVDTVVAPATEKQQKRQAIDDRYWGFVQSSMSTADTLRQQLIQKLPLRAQTPEDRSEGVVFAKSVAGQQISSREVMDAGSYLLGLSKRVAATGTNAPN